MDKTINSAYNAILFAILIALFVIPALVLLNTIPTLPTNAQSANNILGSNVTNDVTTSSSTQKSSSTAESAILVLGSSSKATTTTVTTDVIDTPLDTNRYKSLNVEVKILETPKDKLIVKSDELNSEYPKITYKKSKLTRGEKVSFPILAVTNKTSGSKLLYIHLKDIDRSNVSVRFSQNKTSIIPNADGTAALSIQKNSSELPISIEFIAQKDTDEFEFQIQLSE